NFYSDYFFRTLYQIITDEEVLKTLKKLKEDIEEEVKFSAISNYEALVTLEK
ncbi:16826_t:CDS:1, partial [Funneliformis mosseae]